jgi:hypothetical protein
MTEEEKKLEESKKKKEFWTKFALYVLFAAIIPLMFLVWRFNLFGRTSKIQIGGWGLFALIFLGVFVTKTIKIVRMGLPYSLVTQILEGIVKVLIPLGIAALCAFYLQNAMKQLFQFLCLTFVCEAVAIVVNPLPKWLHEHQLDEQKNTLKEVLQSLDILKSDKKD